MHPSLNLLQTARLAFCGLFALAAAGSATAQTGVGLVLSSAATHTFPETTVGTTTTFTVTLTNSVAAAQTAYFGGLAAPFSLAASAPISIPGSGTTTLTLQFSPTATGTFTDTLTVVGNIFGSASLILTGTGIQVDLDYASTALAFPATALGATSTATVAVHNVGDGTALLSAPVFSHPAFSLVAGSSTLSIAEGESGTLTFAFAPTAAGTYSETVTIASNDPNEPSVTLTLSATAVSEVSGEVCNTTWTLANSPYTLVGNVTVPAGCTLTIEPGVVVVGSQFDLEVHGSFTSNGTAAQPVIISIGELLSNTKANNMLLSHSIINEFNDNTFQSINFNYFRQINPYTIDSIAYFIDDLKQIEHNIYTNENSSFHVGKYKESWTDGIGQGWSTQGVLNYTNTIGQLNFGMGWGGGENYHSAFSPIFTLNENESFLQASFKLSVSFYNGCSYSHSHWISIDGGPFQQIFSTPCGLTNQLFAYNLTEIAPNAQTVQFKFQNHFYNAGGIVIDDFELTTNWFPLADVSVASFTESISTLSTGGVTLSNSILNGDLISINDSLLFILESSEIVFNDNRARHSHGLGIYCKIATIHSSHSTIFGHKLDGLHAECDTLNWEDTEGFFLSNESDAVDISGYSSMVLNGTDLSQNNHRAIHTAHISEIILKNVRIDHNGGNGIQIDSGGFLSLENCRIRGNSGVGIHSGSPVAINHSNIAYNGGTGIVLTGGNFSTLNNSILWGNNNINYIQIHQVGGVTSTSYSTVQGKSGYGILGGQFYWGDGVIEADPLFADEDLHLHTYSPCVDGGQPWTTDAFMPFGLGGVRADMGMYGGLDNAYWGGQALPDGAALLTAILDSPQDQGNQVGLIWDASYFDNSALVNNVTHYSIWRHFDATGEPIVSTDDGNWEQVGEMTSLSLNGYAFSAATLGNTNAYGEFESCYFVAAHTADPGTYWVSNVVCGESVDNLAPEEPVVNGLVLPSGGVEVQWDAPTDEDYAYTLISSDQGFSATVGSDTLVVDVAALGGAVYTVRHVDVNGNESAPGVWVAGASSGVDIIPLKAGWNLISTDRVPETATPAAFFGGLEPGNLQYVTGFNDGVQYFNPSGLSFLNTLSAVAPGYGYWVRVAAADTLYVAGSALPAGYLPTLDAGWNLVGYTAAAPQAPADFFADFVADGTLEYVTGFNAGATFYDPDGLPFLNTLSQLRNGFGYWVRLTSGTNGLATDGSPAYDLVNGRSALGAFAGDRVEVVTAEGEVVAHLPILQGGYLMTAAVFGDDPATDRVEGVAPGTVLGFRFQGRVAAETVIAGGEMGLREVELTFPDGAEGPLGAGVYPNPTDGPVRFRADLGAGVVSWTVADLAGRTVADGVSGAHAGGAWESGFDASGLAPGLYTWTVRVDGVPAATLPWLRAE